MRRFERKVLRKIYGPVVDKGAWRIGYNDELCKLMAERYSQIYKSTKNTVARPCGEDGLNCHAQMSAERETVRNEKNRKT